MKETPEQKRRRLLGLARANVSNAYSSGEHSIMQAIAAYNELEKVANLLYERLEEWYGIYFPELKLSNPVTYAKFIIEFASNKKEATEERLEKTLGTQAKEVARQASASIGNEPSAQEAEMIKGLASQVVDLHASMDKLDKHIETSTKLLMPNISAIVDYKIAAELLAKAGSLNKLGIMPSGTVQLLGAEKALFKHLKFGSKPPKYGVIFKLQRISNSSKRVRGKIARLYATKLAIASRADAFSKNFIADKLNADIERRMERINKGADNRPRTGRPK